MLLCVYGFVNVKGQEFYCNYWVDVKKFKYWWKLVKKEMRYGYVKLSDGRQYIYYYGRYKWRWSRLKDWK